LEFLFGGKASGLSVIDLSKFDVIHVSQQNFEDGIDLVGAVGRSCPERLVVTVHIVERLSVFGQRLGWLRHLYPRYVYGRIRNSARFAFVCSSAMERFKAIMGSEPRFGGVVYNGAEARLSNLSRTDSRRTLGFDDNDFVVGSVGRLEEQKNYAVLIRAFANFCSSNCNAHLVLVGDGSQRVALEREAVSLGIQNRLTITGWLEDPERILQAMDVFVLPSWFEGFPFALVEALMGNRVCLASSIAPHYECLAGHSELLFDPADHSTLAALLRRVCEGDPRLVRAARDAILIASQKFSFDAMVDGMISLYKAAPPEASDCEASF
jgi:glycosyltransferase involved in cell wall biosynthesis